MSLEERERKTEWGKGGRKKEGDPYAFVYMCLNQPKKFPLPSFWLILVFPLAVQFFLWWWTLTMSPVLGKMSVRKLTSFGLSNTQKWFIEISHVASLDFDGSPSKEALHFLEMKEGRGLEKVRLVTIWL